MLPDCHRTGLRAKGDVRREMAVKSTPVAWTLAVASFTVRVGGAGWGSRVGEQSIGWRCRDSFDPVTAAP